MAYEITKFNAVDFVVYERRNCPIAVGIAARETVTVELKRYRTARAISMYTTSQAVLEKSIRTRREKRVPSKTLVEFRPTHGFVLFFQRKH